MSTRRYPQLTLNSPLATVAIAPAELSVLLRCAGAVWDEGRLGWPPTRYRSLREGVRSQCTSLLRTGETKLSSYGSKQKRLFAHACWSRRMLRDRSANATINFNHVVAHQSRPGISERCSLPRSPNSRARNRTLSRNGLLGDYSPKVGSCEVIAIAPECRKRFIGGDAFIRYDTGR
jgi:hypothetical protein